MNDDGFAEPVAFSVDAAATVYDPGTSGDPPGHVVQDGERYHLGGQLQRLDERCGGERRHRRCDAAGPRDAAQLLRVEVIYDPGPGERAPGCAADLSPRARRKARCGRRLDRSTKYDGRPATGYYTSPRSDATDD